MDKLLHYVNLDGRINALYSTPSIYTVQNMRRMRLGPWKQRTISHRINAYWTGYFTSRPALKRYVRVMSRYYLAARHLEFSKGRSGKSPNTDRAGSEILAWGSYKLGAPFKCFKKLPSDPALNTDSLPDALAIAQHHDAV
ncbi:unnamed protein product [Arabis nemorensis]|uniref:Glycoside hydrolase family 38 central domain-containing protein n=1 Tax=Arabis nemorensis TaxID=586526 RepID=A0A565ARN5_9BRAS|nr:unnamed protein product [Arabis nemorensis]